MYLHCKASGFLSPHDSCQLLRGLSYCVIESTWIWNSTGPFLFLFVFICFVFFVFFYVSVMIVVTHRIGGGLMGPKAIRMTDVHFSASSLWGLCVPSLGAGWWERPDAVRRVESEVKKKNGFTHSNLKHRPHEAWAAPGPGLPQRSPAVLCSVVRWISRLYSLGHPLWSPLPQCHSWDY